ncbi:hypothetical protein Hdeb2414_s0010g00339981 [Helianthus debilis subsp. tardiflorus]
MITVRPTYLLFIKTQFPLLIFAHIFKFHHKNFFRSSGLARVLHFEILCRAAGYDPSLLSFRRFFRLAKNSDWFTFETSQVDVFLISSMVSTLGSWKVRFFWVSESIVPFKMIWRHPDAILNELEPSEDELDSWFLKSIRACPSSRRLHPFPEPLLVLMGISTLWDKPDRDPVLMRDSQGMRFIFPTFPYFYINVVCVAFSVSAIVMSTLDFLKSDDTSDVVFADAASAEGEDAVVRGFEHRFEGSVYVNVPNVKGFVNPPVSKHSTRRSTRRKGVGPPSTSETIDLGDKLDVEDT